MKKDFTKPELHHQKPDAFYGFLGKSRLGFNLVNYFESFGLECQIHSSREFFKDPNTFLNSLPTDKLRTIFLSSRDPENFENSKVLRHFLPGVSLVHFSASSLIDGATSWHPLASFSNRIFSVDELKQIPFVSDFEAQELEKLMGLETGFFPNPRHRIPAQKRKLYHGLASYVASSTVFIWEHFGAKLQSELGLSTSVAQALCKSVAQNLDVFFDNPDQNSALSGPLARGDFSQLQTLLETLNKLDPKITDLFLASAALKKEHYEHPQPADRF